LKNQYVKAIKLVIKREDGIIKLRFKIDEEAYNQIKDMLEMYQGEILKLVALEKNDDKHSFTITLKPSKHLFNAIAEQLKSMLRVS